MKIRAIMLVRNEADVIEDSVLAAACWANELYVLDNGSTDATWSRLAELQLAIPHLSVVSRPGKYRRSLRADVFNANKHKAVEGDWWAIVDADEFYLDDPWILAHGLDPKYNTIRSSAFQYRYTVTDHETGREYPDLHYYENNHSEARMVRHEDGMVWVDTDFPDRIAKVAPVRLRLQHYQHRSPRQMKARYESRQAAPLGTFKHEKRMPSWDMHIALNRLCRDDRKGLVETPDRLTPIPPYPNAVKRLAHGIYRPARRKAKAVRRELRGVQAALHALGTTRVDYDA